MTMVSIDELPETLKYILPVKGAEFYMSVYNKAYDKHGSDTIAHMIAWDIVKRKFKKEGNNWTVQDVDFMVQELMESELEPTEDDSELIVNDVDGELIIDAVLASTKPFINDNGEERVWTEEALMSMAEQINTLGSTNPTFTHQELKEIWTKYGNNVEMIANELRNNRGLIKNIRAVVEKGKLWIRAMLDKRYKNHVSKFKGVSIEAFSTPVGKSLTNPKYLGFIFTNNPRDKLAKLAS